MRNKKRYRQINRKRETRIKGAKQIHRETKIRSS